MWMSLPFGVALGDAVSVSALDDAMKPWWVTLYNWRVWALSLGLVYLAYQKHLLPNAAAKAVGRISFYPTWPFTYLARRHDYWTLMDSHVFLGAAPMSFMSHVDDLHARGVRAVVNLCDEYNGPVAQYKHKHIIQLHLPTIDHTEPSVEDLQAAVTFIQEKTASGVRVYVHCKSGNGRSAAVVFAWLLQHRSFSLEETQEYMNGKRRVRKQLFKQPQIVEFYRRLQAQRATTADSSVPTSN